VNRVKLTYACQSMSEPFVITDGSGQDYYKVATTTPDYGEGLSLRDAEDSELAVLARGRIPRWLEVRIGGDAVARVQSPGQFFRRYLIDTAAGHSPRIIGEVLAGGYALVPESDPTHVQAHIDRRIDRFPARARVAIWIAGDQEALPLTALALAIEYLCCHPTMGEFLIHNGFRRLWRALGRNKLPEW
jgi:uncharacterized protein YxjI